MTKIKLNEFATLEITMPAEANITQFAGLFRKLQAIERVFDSEVNIQKKSHHKMSDLNTQIIELKKTGMQSQDIASKLKIDRQKVYNVCNMAKKKGVL